MGDVAAFAHAGDDDAPRGAVEQIDGGGEIPIQGPCEGSKAIGLDPEDPARGRQIGAWSLVFGGGRLRLVCFRHGVVIQFQAYSRKKGPDSSKICRLHYDIRRGKGQCTAPGRVVSPQREIKPGWVRGATCNTRLGINIVVIC